MFIKVFLRILKVFLKKYYHYLRYFIERYVLGTKLQKIFWRYRHYYDFNYRRYNHHSSDLSGDMLLESLASFKDVNNFLDAGCGLGTNLKFIRNKYPKLSLYGVDINKNFIENVKKEFNDMKDQLIFFHNCSLDNMHCLGTNSIDIVSTDAVLMYIAPDRIEKVLMELKRVAKKGMILIEYNLPDGSEYLYKGGRWLYNYNFYFNKLFSDFSLKSKSCKRGNNLDDWVIYGQLIQVEFLKE